MNKKEVSTNRIVREILSRKDPAGYYVVVAINSTELKEILNRYKYGDIIVEDIGGITIIRSKTRKIVELLTRELVSKKLLADT
ncbi:MAG: hypothetical protein QW101_01295 [Ignisphaera sp.]|uniref:Uncharacterized protein n=1 Tax=Ignisphaera aggregans TaxID=334771 RepID=A0A7J3MWF0_9CREN